MQKAAKYIKLPSIEEKDRVLEAINCATELLSDALPVADLRKKR
jgi:hypothetical protein